MFVQADRGNCQFLKRCVQPLLSGSQLQVILGCVSQLFTLSEILEKNYYRQISIVIF
jgi:hypothetical protein